MTRKDINNIATIVNENMSSQKRKAENELKQFQREFIKFMDKYGKWGQIILRCKNGDIYAQSFYDGPIDPITGFTTHPIVTLQLTQGPEGDMLLP